MVRQLRAAAAEAQGRQELRALLLGHFETKFNESLEQGNPDGAWQLFASAAGLYEATELTPERVDQRLCQMASRILAEFEPRGDEARVLSALALLAGTATEREQYQARYEAIATWSEEARQSLRSNTERVLGLVEVFRLVTTIAPLEQPVNRLSELYLERHRLLQGTFEGGAGLQALMSPRGRSELQSLLGARGQSVADLVTLYLRAGRPAEVRRLAGQLGDLSERDRELVQATRDLRSSRRRSRAFAALASSLGREHPDVAIRLCHQGHREFPENPLFAQWLAEVYRHLGDAEGALDYYEVTLTTDSSQENFERTLEFVALRLEAQLNDDDTRAARETFGRSQRILTAFTERFPDQQPPIRIDQLSYLIGVGEFNAGNIDEAVTRLEASLGSRPSRGALVQLGIIAERRGQIDQAVRHFRAALDLRGDGATENPLARAVVLGHLADAYSESQQQARARSLYEEALEMLAVAENNLPAEVRPEIRLERGFTLFKLNRHDEARLELEGALDGAPNRRSFYGRLLSFYVGRGTVEPALSVFRRALNHSDLGRIWKTYYSMWIVGLQRRLSQEPEALALRYLNGVEGNDWIGRLGRFYAGQLSFENLLNGAETAGQRAEAYYYEAVNQISQGNRDQGIQLLQQVIDSNMMGYYEYEFARRLRQELAIAAPVPTAAAQESRAQ
jgi:tetratricopeptide (TPR) repeat protein